MNPISYREIQALAEKYSEKLIAFRRHLHANPELSFQEYKTSAFIQEALASAGIAFNSKIAGTGILAEVSGSADGKTIALRGDMDALPIQEENHCDYSSNNAGVMHACGHDVHSTCIYGAALIVQE
ncbi:MAG: M20/M25/M40 family metallo-hydrolase, partial [Bacteroidia bacterium]